jgi:hypothetical protein
MIRSQEMTSHYAGRLAALHPDLRILELRHAAARSSHGLSSPLA